jgi:hypothetical protein
MTTAPTSVEMTTIITFKLRAAILEVSFKTGAIDQKRRFREITAHTDIEQSEDGPATSMI